MKTNCFFLTLMIGSVLCLTGCSDPLDSYELVFDRYYTTTLKETTSADVLSSTQDPDTELLSQSESVVAVWGKEGKKDRTHWFNMITFDEDAMTAVRKYAFILEETTRGINRTPKPGLRLDAEVVLDADVLDAAYANNNEKQIAILKTVQSAFNKDAAELTFDSAMLKSSSMMVNQAINNALNKLRTSPAYAAHLVRPEGMAFDHMTLGESHIRMLIEDDIVKVKIKAGKVWFKDYWLIDKPFEEHPDVRHM